MTVADLRARGFRVLHGLKPFTYCTPCGAYRWWAWWQTSTPVSVTVAACECCGTVAPEDVRLVERLTEEPAHVHG